MSNNIFDTSCSLGDYPLFVSLGYDCEISQRLSDCFRSVDSFIWSWAFQDHVNSLKILDLNTNFADKKIEYAWDYKGIRFPELGITFHTRNRYWHEGQVNQLLFETEKNELLSRISHMSLKFKKIISDKTSPVVFILKIHPHFSEKDTYELISTVVSKLDAYKIQYRLAVVYLEKRHTFVKKTFNQVKYWAVSEYNLNSEVDKIDFQSWLKIKLAWYEIINYYSPISKYEYMSNCMAVFSKNTTSKQNYCTLIDDDRDKLYEYCRYHAQFHDHYRKKIAHILLTDSDSKKNLSAAIFWLSVLEYPSTMDKIRYCELLVKRGRKEDYNKSVEVLSSIDNKLANLPLSRAYRYGLGVDVDLDMAAKLLKDAIQDHPEWSNEYFDVLWQINTPESNQEAVEVANFYATTGNGSAKGRLSRAYREGRGVPKDLDKALILLRETIVTNPEWCNELFDLLWSMDTKETKAEAIDIAKYYAAKGNVGAKKRLKDLDLNK